MELSGIFWNPLESFGFFGFFWILFYCFGYFWILFDTFGFFLESDGLFLNILYYFGIFWILLSLQVVSEGCLCRQSLQVLFADESFEYFGIF